MALGLVALIIGLGGAAFAVLRRSLPIFLIGAAYLFCSSLLLLAAGSLASNPHHVSNHRRRDGTPPALKTRDSKSGMTLVLTVLLLGLAAVLIIEAQMSASLALRHARTKQERTLLRLSASDATWHFLKTQARSTFKQLDADTAPESAMHAVLPSGIETDVTASKQTSAKSTILPMAAGSLLEGDLYLVSGAASRNETEELVSCLVHRTEKGRLEMIGWLENK
jgi:hypothetical protein